MAVGTQSTIYFLNREELLDADGRLVILLLLDMKSCLHWACLCLRIKGLKQYTVHKPPSAAQAHLTKTSKSGSAATSY